MLSIKLSENGGKAPEAVPYMPAGRHVISATVNGRVGTREVVVDRAACERLQADLEELLRASAAGERARPMLMFDHRAGAAAAKPLGFEWDEERGVLLRVEWTQAGREAVEGGNYGYVSPAFRCARDTGLVAGLGRSTVEVGSLVNDPAFERNECIAAARAEVGREEEVVAARFLPPREGVAENSVGVKNEDAAGGSGGENNRKTEKMDEIKTLLGLPPDADEAAICAAISSLKEKESAGAAQLEQVQAENEKSKAELEQHKSDAADAFVKRQQDAGKIPPRDEERLQAARRLYMNDPKGAELIYAGMKRADGEFNTDEEEVRANKVHEDYAGMTIEEMLEAGL